MPYEKRLSLVVLTAIHCSILRAQQLDHASEKRIVKNSILVAEASSASSIAYDFDESLDFM